MATAGIALNNAASFGSFQTTSFVPTRTSNNAINDPQTSQRATEPAEMAQSSRPPSTQLAAATDRGQLNASPSTFEPLEAAGTTVEGILGPNKDGRVRNPVPSKLKGKTDTTAGTFGVMGMSAGMGGGGKKAAPEAAEARDAAARKTSENTASRAKAAAAMHSKYVPPNKRIMDAQEPSPFATEKPQRKRPLAPDETKVEQARLLTLLRSINPVTVVDQICKAIAYFGGIPGAPPPEDGIFPSSANTGETGALFIGWVSEIFPSLPSPEVPRMQAVPGKKKQTKAAKAKLEMLPDEPEAPNPSNGFGFGQAISAPAWGLPQSLAQVNTASIPTPEANSTAETPATPAKQNATDASNTASGSKRGRGRPKGSTNKSRKSEGLGSGNVSGSAEGGGQQVQQPSQVQGSGLGSSEQNQASYAQMTPNQSITGQPDMEQYPPQPWLINATKTQNGSSAKTAVSDDLTAEEIAVLNAFRTPGTNDSVTPNAASAQLPQNATGTGSGGVKRKRAPAKPKQPAAAAPVSNDMAIQQPAQPARPVQHAPILPPTKTGSMSMPKNDMQWNSVENSTPTQPPAKKPRQRKPKAPVVTDPPPHQQAASILHQNTPPSMPSTIPDSQETISQQSVPVARPQAEGLEAHYERFVSASTAPQQNGRSNTPSINSVASITPQQHIRQLQKPASVPQSQQQSPAQAQAQLQMQRQKSQQGQREDTQKMPHAQTAAARPSSTGGYFSQQTPQQQRQSTSGTQYPAHQPSQLSNAYSTSTHSASPQLSNNSYRTASTHTMAQASPQFPQTESNTYRTTSPYNIAQPSPSFTQPESNYRNSTHSMTQPSPTYSQPENPYRTASALSNSTTSYNRTPQTQTQTSHQSHYNHFPDTSYVDLPTLDSLNHSTGTSSNSLSAGGYGQGLGVGLGASSSSSRSGSHSVYPTSSGLGTAFDTTTNDYLRNVSRGGSNSTYGTSSGLAGFESEQEMRERLMRNIGGRR